MAVAGAQFGAAADQPGEPTPVRVGYDVSVLLHARGATSGRTGIFRVVDAVARGLARRPDCNLRFYLPHSLDSHITAREYLRAEPMFAHVPMGTARPQAIARARVLRDIILGINVEPPFRDARRAFRSALSVARKAHELVHRPLPDVKADELDVYHSPYGPLPTIRPLGGRKVPRVLTVYDLIPLRMPEHFDRGTLRTMQKIYGSLRPDDWAIAISECTRRDLLAIRPDLDGGRVVAAPLAADETLFYPESSALRREDVRKRHGVGDGPYLLSLNTLEPRKNLDHLVRAFARLLAQESVPGLQLVLAGAKGWKTARLYAALDAISPRLRNRVVLAGYVADEDLAPLYSGAIGFVYPSLYEGFGLPPLEAMQCGIPVVTSDTSSLPEVVGTAGIMLPPHDEDALAQAMLRLYEDAALRQRMGAASLAQAATFNWERCVAQTMRVYRAAQQAG